MSTIQNRMRKRFNGEVDGWLDRETGWRKGMAYKVKLIMHWGIHWEKCCRCRKELVEEGAIKVRMARMSYKARTRELYLCRECCLTSIVNPAVKLKLLYGGV